MPVTGDCRIYASQTGVGDEHYLCFSRNIIFKLRKNLLKLEMLFCFKKSILY